MNINSFDIVSIIEKNAITRLNKDYENRLINKIKTTFTESQQQLFVGSFYSYLKYDSKKDFIIDFDSVWKWTGFSRKDNAKTVLNKHFVEEVDYEIIKSFPEVAGKPIEEEKSPERNKVGRPTDKIMLSVNTFKKFCLKANTKKADEIHDYYIKLEELLQETMNEESSELRNQLSFVENEKQKLNDLLYRKKTDFKKGTCIYVGKNSVEEDFKVGNSVNAPNRRIGLSSGTTTDFVMENCWYTKYSKIIEDTVKIKFAKYRVVHRKEFYKKESHDDIVYFISSMVDFFEKVDEDDESVEEEEISTDEVPKLYKETKESDYIVIRKIDGYIHLPSICKYFDRTYNAYAHSTINKPYLEEQVRINPEIIRYSTGANKELQGSWGAPIIAIHLANWISSDIGERVSKYIEEQKENIEDKPEKIGFTMRELMSTTNKKEELQQLSKALGLACGLSRTKRQMSDSIFNYLENCEVFVDTAKKYFKTCDKCKEMKSLDTENFIRQHEVGFMHTCKGCLEVSFEKSTVSEVVEKDVEVKQGEKFCNGCKTVKKSEQFHKNGSRIAAYCTPCMSAYRKEQRLRAKI